MADRPRCASSSEISLRSHENHRSYGPILYVDWAYCLGQESCIVTLKTTKPHRRHLGAAGGYTKVVSMGPDKEKLALLTGQ